MKNAELFEYLISVETDDCVIWPNGKSSAGYASLYYKGNMCHGHRLALEIFQGKQDSKVHCCHNPDVCSSVSCINPRHLYWGTAKQNQKDRLISGTDLRGQKHPNAKLTAEDVRKIRRDKRIHSEIAKDYPVSLSNIRLIKSNHAWSWLA